MAAKQVENEGEFAIIKTVSTGVIHPYIMNNAKAKKELLKNAKIDPISEPTTKPETTKFQLSSGAYKEVVFPLLDHWSGSLKDNVPNLTAPDQDRVTLVSVMNDMDQTSRSMDALVHFKFNKESIQVFFYHTNQSAMVQGHSHKTFYNIFLLPALNKIINESLLEIKEFNCQIIKALSSPVPPKLDDSVWRSATPDRRNTLRFTRSKATKCYVCKKECSSKAQMKIHMETYHNGGLKLAHKPRAGVAVTRTAGLVQRQRSMAQYQSILSSEALSLGSPKVPAPSSPEVPALPFPEVLALPLPRGPGPGLAGGAHNLPGYSRG